MSCYVNTVNGPVSPRVYLKTPNAPGQRIFSRCAAPFFLEIRQYSCEKMSCSAQKFLAAGHIGSFQIHPRELGITLMHEHLAELNNSMKRCYADWFHADIFLEKIKPVFQKAKKYGLSTYVDQTAVNMGRDIRFIKRVSESCDVNIVAATGLFFYEESWQIDKPYEEISRSGQIWVGSAMAGGGSRKESAGAYGSRLDQQAHHLAGHPLLFRLGEKQLQKVRSDPFF